MPQRTGESGGQGERKKQVGPVFLDGRDLARRRQPDLAARATSVAGSRGRPPKVGLVAFEDGNGGPGFIPRKLLACEAAGVEAVPVLLPPTTGTKGVLDAIAALVDGRPDALFLELPFPHAIEPEVVVAAVPEAIDIDVMTAPRIRRYFEGEGPPPLTISAGLALLDGFKIDVAGMSGIVIAGPSPFAEMFREALARRGARMRPLVPPISALKEALHAQMIVAAAGQPALLDAARLPAGAVVIDAGYFNRGGIGDVDTSRSTEHLGALAPVPGGIGPMTVSMLVERVIACAERGD